MSTQPQTFLTTVPAYVLGRPRSVYANRYSRPPATVVSLPPERDTPSDRAA